MRPTALILFSILMCGARLRRGRCAAGVAPADDVPSQVIPCGLSMEAWSSVHGARNGITVLIRGGAFRHGSIHSTDTNDTSGAQQEVCNSYYSFLIEPWAQAFRNISVIVDVTTTRPRHEVETCFKCMLPWIKFMRVRQQPFETQVAGILATAKLAIPHIHYGDPVLFTRADIILKKPLAVPYMLNRVFVPFRMNSLLIRGAGTLKSGRQRVADTFIYFPSMRCLTTTLKDMVNRGAKYDMHQLADFVTPPPAYLVPQKEAYDSDSEKEVNPFYRMAGRVEGGYPRWWQRGVITSTR
jgi:hypothetical protein